MSEKADEQPPDASPNKESGAVSRFLGLGGLSKVADAYAASLPSGSPETPDEQEEDLRPAMAGGDEGAIMQTDYLGQQQRLTLIDMEDLEEFRTSAQEEFSQFSIGEFFASGAFWLFVQRMFGADDRSRDILLWFSVFAFLAGAAVAYYGYRQLKRRRKKIDRIIERAEETASMLAKKRRTRAVK